MNIGLDKKILGGFILCGVFLIVTAVISFENRNDFLSASQLVTHTHEVLYEFEQTLVDAVESETGVRGYLLTGNDEFMEPYRQARKTILVHVERVKLLTKDNPVQQINVDNLKRLIDKHQSMLENNLALKEDGASLTDINAAVLKTRPVLVDIRTTISNARNVENELLQKRELQSAEDSASFTRLFVVLLVVIVLVLLAMYFIITTNIHALRRLEKDASENNKILAATGALVRGMQGDKTLPLLGDEVLRQLVSYLNAAMGVFYVTQQRSTVLKAEATFSAGKQSEVPSFTFGDGLAGQVAAEKRSMVLSDVQADHFKTDTAFGSVRPRNILAFPLIAENNVVGVIELGSLKGFSQEDARYVELVSGSIAIAVVSASARNIMRDLLEETQRQSEELQSQQEELRRYNDELQAKTDMLERSEVELTAQQTELEHANVDLSEKAALLEEQKAALQEAKQQIELKAREVEVSSRYKSEFLANMSHELRTPLNSILILAQLLSDNKSQNLSDKETEFARNIYTSGTGLLNLINEILDLSKIEAGKMELEISTLHVVDMVQTVKEMVEGIALSKSISLDVRIDDSVKNATLTTDRQRVEQILRNLLSNALKFTPAQGKVTLYAGRIPDGVDLKNQKLRQQKNMVMFSVTDTGIGIPEDKQELVFEAFRQADGGTKRKFGGTGLGLSISRELAAVLGGEIQLKSEVGIGSTFMLFLPIEYDMAMGESGDKTIALREPVAKNSRPAVVKTYEEVVVANDDRASIDDKSRVILIIEDDSKFAQILLTFIRERGYKGVIASQGNTGLSYARQYKPVAILLDMQLPVMDGNEVLHLIKNDPQLRHIPVQIISAYDRKKEGMLQGAFNYLTKPVSVEDLNSAFDRIEIFSNKKLKKLLIVEDDKQQNIAIRELIGGSDIKAIPAHTGEEAFEMLEHELFDCLIIDLGLPNMSGFQLMERIRADERFSRIPIIVYTGRDLKKEDNVRLHKLADTVVLKTANSHARLLDETNLFLHRVESQLPKDKQFIIQKLRKTDEILKDKKVLIVDDDIRNIYSLTNALEEEGLTCVTAENGRVALDTLKNDTSIDIVLMDIMMPEMDGFEATIEIRKLEEFRKLPIIALTAKAMKGDREKCLSVGMSDYISKPVQVSQLLSLMRVWLFK